MSEIKPYLLHGDYGFDNVLVDQGKISGVLDWANAKYGDFLYDVAWLDFWSLFGSTTWIERLEELTELLPEQGSFQRWLSRRVRGLL